MIDPNMISGVHCDSQGEFEQPTAKPVKRPLPLKHGKEAASQEMAAEAQEHQPTVSGLERRLGFCGANRNLLSKLR